MASTDFQEIIRRMPQDKDQREQVAFDIFREKYGLVGEFPKTPKDKPGPDFIGSLNGSTLGVEFTEIYNDEKIYGKTLKEHEVLKDGIVNRAYEKAKSLGLPPLYVCVIFSDNISKGSEPRLTNSIFEIVRNNIPLLDNRIKINRYNNLPKGIASIYIKPRQKNSFWHWTEFGAIETRFSNQLQRIINKKAAKISGYRKKCDECWLIVVAPGFNCSSFYEFSEEMETVCYKSPFEKIFFIEMFDRTLKELKNIKLE